MLIKFFFSYMGSKERRFREDVYSSDGEDDDEEDDYFDEDEDEGLTTDSDVDAAEEGN